MFPPEITHPAHAEIRANAIDTRSAEAILVFLGMSGEDEIALKLGTRCGKGRPLWIVRSAQPLLLLLCRARSGADEAPG